MEQPSDADRRAEIETDDLTLWFSKEGIGELTVSDEIGDRAPLALAIWNLLEEKQRWAHGVRFGRVRITVEQLDSDV